MKLTIKLNDKPVVTFPEVTTELLRYLERAQPCDGISMVLESTVAGPVDIVLTKIGPAKIGLIKEVRHFTGFGLKEAKDLVDQVEVRPVTVQSGATPERASQMKAAFEAVGATVELRREL